LAEVWVGIEAELKRWLENCAVPCWSQEKLSPVSGFQEVQLVAVFGTSRKTLCG
jgi:hypothetical protein